MVLDWRCHFIRIHRQTEPEKIARDINLLRFLSESQLHIATFVPPLGASALWVGANREPPIDDQVCSSHPF